MTMFLALFVALAAHAGESDRELTQEEIEASQFAKKRLVILQSTHDYPEARKTAEASAKALNIPLKLRDLSPNTKTGLTHTQEECEQGGFGWPCYVARGRSDDGAYVSVEHSNAYKGFSRGYFIVVAASAASQSEVISTTLAAAKEQWPSAYSKQTEVYLGCTQ